MQHSRLGLGLLTALTLAGAASGQGSVATDQAPGGENPLGLSIHHVTIGVSSLDTERAFYHNILGFAVGPLRKRPHYDVQQMLIPGFRIDMIGQPGSVRPSKTMGTDKQGWLHIALQVPSILPVYHRLQAAGAEVTPGRMDGTEIGSVFVTDPEGNRIEIAQP